MTSLILLPLMIYAVCGLVLSLAAHLLALAGVAPGGNALFVALHVGIFPLWIPVVFIGMRLNNGAMNRRAAWDAMTSGCPAWMRYMTRGFFIYALVNFFLFVMTMPAGATKGGEPSAAVWRGFSGHWMLFYSAGLATLTTAYRRGWANLQPRCRNGHVVSVGDKFCPTCGAAIGTPQSGGAGSAPRTSFDRAGRR